MTLITQIGYSPIGAFLYKISAIWLGTIYFLFFASVLFFITFWVLQYFGDYSIISKNIGLGLFILAIGVSAFGVVNSFNINVTKYNVLINNLPEEWENKDIVMFADSHFGNIRNIKFGKKLVSKINEQNPEIVLIAGDYYDGPSVNSKKIAELMSRVKTKKGIFFASGNHEEYGDTVSFIKSLADSGVNILNNKVIDIDGLQIVGIDYKNGLSSDLILATLNSIDLKIDRPKILIKHVPDSLSQVESKDFDIVVSGHTHNGQVWPGPYLATKIFKEFSYGLNFINKMAVVTTSGVGTWGPPQRVGTRSEIVAIRLNNKSE